MVTCVCVCVCVLQLEGQVVALLVQNMERLDEQVKEEADGVYNTLGEHRPSAQGSPAPRLLPSHDAAGPPQGAGLGRYRPCTVRGVVVQRGPGSPRETVTVVTG